MSSRVMDEEDKIYRSLGFLEASLDSARRRKAMIIKESVENAQEIKDHKRTLVDLTMPADSDLWQWDRDR